MANPEHFALLQQGVAVWNEWRKNNPAAIADFLEANLYKADLNGAQLISTNLCGATLSGSTIYGASVWDIKVDDQTNQQNLVITPLGTPGYHRRRHRGRSIHLLAA